MGSIISLLSNALSAISAFFGYQKDVEEAKNTPAMQANATAQTRQTDADQINSQIAAAHSKDPKVAAKAQNEIRTEFSED